MTHRIEGGFVVSGEARRTNLAGFPRLDECANGLAPLERLEVARVQEHDIEAVGAEPLERAVDGASD